MCVCNLKVGAGKAVINFPEEIFPIEKFNGVNDDIHVRIVLIESNINIAIVSYELTSLRPYEIESIKNIVNEKTGIDKENIWVCVTHTFSAPHVRSEQALSKADKETINKNKILCKELENSLNNALNKALESKELSKIGSGKGYCYVNTNRDVYTSSGWWIGSNNNGISDKTVPIIRFDNLDGNPIAIIYSYDIQSSIMDKSFLEDGTRLITGDLTGKASSYIESLYDENLIAMYIVGAAGDQAPLFKANHMFVDDEGNIKEDDIGKNGFDLVEELGVKLAVEIIKSVEKIDTHILKTDIVSQKYFIECPGQVMPKNIKDIKPTHSYEYVEAEKRQVELEMMSIDNIAIVGLMPELASISAIDIRKSSPFELTMVLTMVNGGAKYMVDEMAYEKNTYGAMNSKFGKGSAEIVVKESRKRLAEIIDRAGENI